MKARVDNSTFKKEKKSVSILGSKAEPHHTFTNVTMEKKHVLLKLKSI